MRWAHLPAALMLGPMLAAIVVAIRRPGAKLPRRATALAQAVFGCLIAKALSPDLLGALAPHWPVLLGVNLLTLLGIFALGWVVTRYRWLPGTAGIWGMSPGGAGAMVLLAESYGGDPRLVAVMQYLRLLAAVLAVIAVASLLGTPHVSPRVPGLPGARGTEWLAPVDPIALAVTGALAVAGLLAAALLRQAVLVLLVPVFGGVALQFAGLTGPAVPPLLSAAAIALVGWHIGLSFTRAALAACARLIPRILAGIAAILLLCAGASVLLARLTRASFLTAYLALNPGGADTVLVMAGSVAVDLPLIMAMQVSRIMLVVTLAPLLGRWAARRHLGQLAA